MPTCPSCGLLHPQNAIACGRGYQFTGSAPISASPTPQISQPTESAKAVGVTAGLVGGIGCGAMLFIMGLLLSMTGVGLIIGVPMMVAALFMPFLMPALGLAQIKGPCPYCSTTVYAQSTAPGVTCPGCKKRVVIREKRFIRVE